jgi:transposase InsO family protein
MIRLRTKGHTLKSICNYVGISRQAYHKRLQRTKTKHNLYNKMEKIVLENRQTKSRSGLRTIFYKENLSAYLGVNQFEEQMSARGHALKPYRSFLKTTDSRGQHYKFDNLIEGMELNRANQVIVGDITYYTCHSELYYIFQFVDYYTLEIKGIVGSKNMEGINSEKCLRQVFKYNQCYDYENNMIIHTDAGGQYRSHKYQSMLRKYRIQPSQAKSCFENGLSERVNGIIKNEYLIDYEIKNINHLNRVLKQIQDQANNVWPSKTLGYKTPTQYAAWTRGLDEKDRPKKQVKIVQ